MKILTSEQMRNIDRRTTERFGIPSMVLMENAALAVVDAVFDHYPESARVAVFCGTGQNGGDGLAVARHLANRGVVPIVAIVGDRAGFTGDAMANLVICERLGIRIDDVRETEDVSVAVARAADADLIVDAIFGTGLNRPPAGIHAETIRAMAELRIPILAIDLPSGADASTAQPFEPCVHADITVTFAAPKVCHVFEPAAAMCGEVIVADISIPDAAVREEAVTLALTTPADIQPFVAPRFAATHKGTYGHVAIVAGSFGKSGAAVLCARGAIRSGAGLVSVVTDPQIASLVNAGSIESMTFPASLDAAALSSIVDFIGSKDGVLIGPGLRDDEESYGFVRELVSAIEVPLVLDASGLNAFAGRAAELNPDSRVRVITPHPGELSRLLGRDTKSINENRIESARDAARISNCVVVLKGHQTLIASPDGSINVNPTGNPGMASGGMGDVLGGMVVAFLAREVDPYDAACTAVYLHGLTGDLVKEEIGDTGMAAGDLAEKIPLAIQRLRRIS